MRTDNRSVKSTVISIYFILIVFAILFFTVFKSFNVFTGNTHYIILGVFVLILVFHTIARYFEYDSDGEKISVINKGFILTEYLNYREKQVEFLREELQSFEIRNLLFLKTLTLILKTRNGHYSNERFNITLLRRKKRRYLKQSLRKIIKLNKKKKEGSQS